MKRSKAFIVYFVGFPGEFRQAHQAELEGVTTQAHWVQQLPRQAENRVNVFVLNLDQKANTLPQTLQEALSAAAGAEWIAVSSHDSAKLAMHYLREGFSDFLAQPVSSDELVLSLLRCRQRALSSTKALEVNGDIGRALTQIASSSSLAILQLRTTLALQAIVGRKVLWLVESSSSRGNKNLTVLTPCHRQINGAFWVRRKPALTKQKKDRIKLIAEHAELTLMNLQRVEKLKLQTFVDDLTGLYNPRYLRFALEAAAVQYAQRKTPFSVLFLDVDRFKQVNDQNGHLIGSEFLVALSRIIKNAVRVGDVVFRYGGDEFVVLLKNTGLARTVDIAERLRRLVEQRSFVIQGVRLKSTVSIGAAVYPEHSRDLGTLLHLADEAMYMAKKVRNQVRVASDRSTVHPSRRPALRTQL